MQLWHATTEESAEIILQEGLRGGNGLHGGHATEYTEIPTLFLAEEGIPPEKYEKYGGVLLLITIDKEELLRKGFEKFCGSWIKEGNGILLEPELISHPARDYEEGLCEPSRWCSYCPDNDNCKIKK